MRAGRLRCGGRHAGDGRYVAQIACQTAAGSPANDRAHAMMAAVDKGPSRVGVLNAGARDRAAVTTMLARAFADDPAMSYILPDPTERAKRLPGLFRLLFDSDARAGLCLTTSGGGAATLWRGPGRAHIGWAEMLGKAVPMLATFGSALPRALRVSDAIAARMPTGAFWYLHVAGCDPVVQGRGFGAAAVGAGLRRAANRLPCYLETASERNLGFYSALGFVVTAEWCVPRGGPSFWSMLRAPDVQDIEQPFI